MALPQQIAKGGNQLLPNVIEAAAKAGMGTIGCSMEGSEKTFYVS
jgi:hypothetical protein